MWTPSIISGFLIEACKVGFYRLKRPNFKAGDPGQSHAHGLINEIL